MSTHLLSMNIHIAYAEDHTILRHTICSLLKEQGFTVNSFVNGKEMITALECMSALPQVCIINVNMPFLNGFDTARHICQYFPSIRILAYSMSTHDFNIIQMLESGATGYVFKGGDIGELYDAVVAIYQKGFYLNEEVSKVVLDYLQHVPVVPGGQRIVRRKVLQ